jgi:hypothetical protein
MQPTRRPGTLSERLFLTRSAHFWLFGASGPKPPRTVSGVFCGTRKLRTDTNGTGHAGRGHPSQRARGGAEANSGLPGHPTVVDPSSSKAGTSEGGALDDHAFFTTPAPTALTGIDPGTRGDSVPPAG